MRTCYYYIVQWCTLLPLYFNCTLEFCLILNFYYFYNFISDFLLSELLNVVHKEQEMYKTALALLPTEFPAVLWQNVQTRWPNRKMPMAKTDVDRARPESDDDAQLLLQPTDACTPLRRLPPTSVPISVYHPKTMTSEIATTTIKQRQSSRENRRRLLYNAHNF